MNKFKYNFFTILVSFVISTALQAEKLCMPHNSILHQQKRYVSLLTPYLQEKMKFSFPVKQCECWVSSLYGNRRTGFHAGVDFAALKGTNVVAAADGYVIKAEKSNAKNGYGNMILIEHEHKEHTYQTRYAHLDTIEKNIYHQLQTGRKVAVKRDEKIGTVGATGHVIAKDSKSDPSHLHFEIYKDGKRIDPLLYLFASQVMLTKNKSQRKN